MRKLARAAGVNPYKATGLEDVVRLERYLNRDLTFPMYKILIHSVNHRYNTLYKGSTECQNAPRQFTFFVRC